MVERFINITTYVQEAEGNKPIYNAWSFDDKFEGIHGGLW